MVDDIMAVITPEMFETEKKAFNASIVFQLFAALVDIVEISFMNHFIGLNVKAPISAAFGKRQVGLLVINGASQPVAIAPFRIDYPDFGIAYFSHYLSSSIVFIPLAYGNNELVAYGEYGPN
jgi:hypothetical protein